MQYNLLLSWQILLFCRKKFMRSFIFLSLLIAFISCNNQPEKTVNPSISKDSAKVVTNDTILKTRKTVDPKPVASFSKKVPDELNDWKFSVNVYETKETFHYLMKMQYMELVAEDTLKIPNLGIEPEVEIKPGKGEYACIIGFLDKQNQFKEYKEVSAKDGKLKLHILRRYAVATYQEK